MPTDRTTPAARGFPRNRPASTIRPMAASRQFPYARARVDDGLQQVAARADGADACRFRPHVPVVGHDRVAARAPGPPTEEDFAAVVRIASGQQRLKRAQVVNAGFLLLFHAGKQRAGSGVMPPVGLRPVVESTVQIVGAWLS